MRSALDESVPASELARDRDELFAGSVYIRLHSLKELREGVLEKPLVLGEQFSDFFDYSGQVLLRLQVIYPVHEKVFGGHSPALRYFAAVPDKSERRLGVLRKALGVVVPEGHVLA